MTFENLPKDWPTRSLSNTSLAADVVDLTLNSFDRERTSIGLLLCDDSHRLLQPMVINEIADCTAGERRHLFEVVCDAMDDIDATTLVVTLARPSGVHLTDADHGWLETAREVCVARDVRLIGTFLADRDHARSAA